MRTGRGAATVGPAGPRHAGGRGAVPIVASARVSLLSPCARARGQCGDPERKWPLHSEPTAWPGGGVAGMSVTGRRCDEHHRRRGLGPEGPAGRGAGVRLTSCVRPDSPASPARCHPLGAKASEPIREPGASRSGHHTDVLSEGLSETALCPPGAHQLPSRCTPRLEFPTYTNSPVLLRRAPNRHLCWLRQYFPFIAVMRVNIFPEITSEKCAWILNTCDPDIRGERLFQTHTHTRVRASTPAAPRRRVVNSALRAAPPKLPRGAGPAR